MKVIYHIDEMDRWPLVLGNVKNMTAYYHEQKESYTIEVLANSAAVNGYAVTSPEHEDAMKALAGEGVVFAACSNALKGNAMTKDAIFEFITVVPAGVVELAARQAEGYAYIRP